MIYRKELETAKRYILSCYWRARAEKDTKMVTFFTEILAIYEKEGL